MSWECERLHSIFENGKKFEYGFNGAELHVCGIYVTYESGEVGHGGDRIVRIGKTDVTLYTRFSTHFDGNNRNSIFRKNIGRVFLRNDPQKLEEWNNDTTDAETEAMVSEYIKDHVYFKAIEIADTARRAELEKKMIATVSNCNHCRPSQNWLGNRSPETKIRQSGLWQKQNLLGSILNEADLAEIEQALIK